MEEIKVEKMEVQCVNGTSIISNLQTNTVSDRAQKLKAFKEFISNDFVDGVDFGMLPNTDKPCLLKPGFEKIQFYLGLSPRYKLLNREFRVNQEKKYKEYNEVSKKYETTEVIRNFYSWEWSCELYHGDIKVAEGVGCANTEEKKYVSQYKKSETPDSLANTVMKIAKKRALGDAILNIGGISDLYTVDLEDNETIKKLKTDKETKVNKLTKDQIKTIYATVGALGLIDTDLNKILNELGYMNIKEVKPEDSSTILDKVKQLAKERKANNG